MFHKKCEHADFATGSKKKSPIAVSNDTINESSSYDVSEAIETKKSKHASTLISMHTSKSSSHVKYFVVTQQVRLDNTRSSTRNKRVPKYLDQYQL